MGQLAKNLDMRHKLDCLYQPGGLDIGNARAAEPS